MYKKLSVIALLFAFSCNDESINSNNPNIPNYSFSLEINLNLPSNSSLQFISNHIINNSVGARGIVVFNTGSGFVAFDLACPNQSYSECTTPMTISGIDAICDCDETSYSLFSGQGNTELKYQMKQYNVQVNENILTIYN